MGQTATLAAAQELIRTSGADVGILYDVWHFVRAGQTIEDLCAIPSDLIRYVQVNDGLAAIPTDGFIAEAIGERLYPGLGEFPLADLLRHAPRGVTWAIEAPSLMRARAGATAEDQACEAMAALRSVLA